MRFSNASVALFLQGLALTTTTTTSASAFIASPSVTRALRPSSASSSSAAYTSVEAQQFSVDTFSQDSDSEINGSSYLVSSATAKAQLFDAFAALSDVDQYDAVLTGLCAKILDNDAAANKSAGETVNGASTDGAMDPRVARLQDPIRLLQEMNQKRLVASPRSLMALIDVSMQILCA
jgi:hypothetical protein